MTSYLQEINKANNLSSINENILITSCKKERKEEKKERKKIILNTNKNLINNKSNDLK